MSIQSEIDRLSGIKADLKAALAEKGQTVGDVFSTYPAAVRAIETKPAQELITITVSDYRPPVYYDDVLVELEQVGSDFKGQVPKDHVVYVYTDAESMFMVELQGSYSNGGIVKNNMGRQDVAFIPTGDITISVFM